MLEDHDGEDGRTFSALSGLRTALKEATLQSTQVVVPDGGVWSFGQYGTGYDPATFAGTASGAATFCGLQIVGEFPVYVQTGTMVIFR